MSAGFDHLTIVVTDLDDAKRFFGTLGFAESHSVVVKGPTMAVYMGISDWEADHVTLVDQGAPVHQEIQLLRFHRPDAAIDDWAAATEPDRLQSPLPSASTISTPPWPGWPRSAAGRGTTSWPSTTGASSSSTDRPVSSSSSPNGSLTLASPRRR